MWLQILILVPRYLCYIVGRVRVQCSVQISVTLSLYLINFSDLHQNFTLIHCTELHQNWTTALACTKTSLLCTELNCNTLQCIVLHCIISFFKLQVHFHSQRWGFMVKKVICVAPGDLKFKISVVLSVFLLRFLFKGLMVN